MNIGIIESKEQTVPVIEISETYIGGVATYIPDASTLASKFNVLESDIEYFNINGNNIEAKIIAPFTLNGFNSFVVGNNSLLTYFIDKSGNCLVGDNGIKGQIAVQTLHFPHVLSLPHSSGATIVPPLDGIINLPELAGVSDFTFRYLVEGCDDIYIPKALTLGNLAFLGYNSALNSYRKHRFYVDPSMINNAAFDEPKSKGAIVTGIQNFTKPNAVNDLTSQRVFSYITLDFTPPSSLNPINHYEIFTYDGSILSEYKKQGEVTGTGQNVFISLNAISVKTRAVDIFFNRSEFSDPVTIGAMQQTNFPVDKLRSYFNFSGTIGEIKNIWAGILNATNNGATRGVQGLIGNGISLDGSNTVSIPTPYLKGEVTHSIGMWVYIENAPSSRTGMLVCKPQSTGGSHWLLNSNMTMNIGRWGGGNVPTSALPTQQWVHIAYTFNKDTRIQKVYYNAVLNNSVTLASNQKLALEKETIIGVAVPSELKLNAEVDETAIALKEWSQAEISTIVNNGNGITL